MALLPFLADPEIPPLPLSYQDLLIAKGKSACLAYASNLLMHNLSPFSFCTRRKPPPFLCESHLSFAKVQTCRAGTFQAQTHMHTLVCSFTHMDKPPTLNSSATEIILPYLQSKGPPLGPNCQWFLCLPPLPRPHTSLLDLLGVVLCFFPISRPP